jgi:hydrogenase expression/formation protein HypC
MCLAIPGQIVEIVDVENQLAKVEVSGVRRNINVGLLSPEQSQIGNWVLVHVGFALSQIDEKEARETLELLRGMGDVLDEEYAAMEASARLHMESG